jgi:hypothetical protein
MTGPVISRRGVLAAGAGISLGAGVSPNAAKAGNDAFAPERLMADIATYATAGNKAAGGTADMATAKWLSGRLSALGFAVEQQSFEVPWFDLHRADLMLGDTPIALIPQPIVKPTPTNGVLARLRLADTGGDLTAAIALIRLPFRRWSTITDSIVQGALSDAFKSGAQAAILVTTGPSRQVLLLNAPGDAPLFDHTVALLAPADAAPVIAAAQRGDNARLTVQGIGGRRTASNLIARRSKGDRPWLVVSTPRSGWTDCVGERGPGIAIWLALAEWAVVNRPDHNLLFVCNSGHEYENLGASHLVADFGPPPAQTDFWLHLGANVATRDWHELPDRLLPLPSADPFRFLVTSPDIVPLARRIFVGQPGLEMAYPVDQGTAGELTEIVKGSYPRLAGIFGAHRLHHAAGDNLSTVAQLPLAATAAACRDLLAAAT